MDFSIADTCSINARIFRFYHGTVTAIGQGFALYPEHNLTVWWIHKGSVSVQTGDAPLTMAQQGDIFVCMPGVARYQTFSTNAVITSVWLTIDWGTLETCGFDGLPKVLDADECPGVTAICERVEALLRKYDFHSIGSIDDCRVSLTNGLEIRALSADLFSNLIGHLTEQGVKLVFKAHSDPRIDAALKYLKARNVAGAVPYDQLTERTGLSRVHLDRLFRQQLNVTPKQFIEKQSFERAAELLTDSDMPVFEVADALNFQSSAHFCSWFKRQCSLSPNAFRKQQVL